MSDPIPPADDERIRPLTAQQLGLCGPLSDDTSVGPDAARHTPPADDQATRADLAESEALVRRYLEQHGDDAMERVMVEYDRRAEEIENLRDVFSAEMVSELRAENERDVLSGLLRGMARRATSLRSTGEAEIERSRVASRQVAEWRKAELAERTRLRDEIDTLRGEKPQAAAVIDRMREQAGEIHRLRVALDVASAELTEARSASNQIAEWNEAERAELNAAQTRVAAARALADTWANDSRPAHVWYASQIRARLDGPTEAPRHNHDNSGVYGGCPACGTYWPELAVGPAEAAEPATPMQPAPAMTAPQILARLGELDAQAEANPDPRPLGDPVQMVGRYPVQATEAGTPDPPRERCHEYEGATGVRCDQRAGHPLPHAGTHGAPGDDYSIAITWPRLAVDAGTPAQPNGDGRYDLDDVLREAGINPDEAGAPEPERCDVYVRLGEGEVARTLESAYGTAIDVTAKGDVVGVELIGASAVEINGQRVDAGSDTTAPKPAALVAAAGQVLAEWSRMHPSGYLAMYPAMDALRAALPAPRVEPALLGTWADPEFRAHADHKHPVEGRGYCPSEEDR